LPRVASSACSAAMRSSSGRTSGRRSTRPRWRAGTSLIHKLAMRRGRPFRVITGSTLVLAIVALAAIAVARGRIRLALVPVIAIAGAVATSEVLRNWVLARPDLLNQPEYSNSFPSGHATIGLAVAWAAVVVAPPQARRAVAVVGTLIAAAIGIAVVAAAWHRPSDVVGGYLVATAWAAATMAVWVALLPARVDLREIAGERAARTAVRFEWAAAALGRAGMATAVGFTIGSNSDEI
jgi:membrane-associated phospholipid phosphatase